MSECLREHAEFGVEVSSDADASTLKEVALTALL
jgi:hypothetical protein